VSLLNSGGTEILGTHDSIYGPGGQDIMTDTDGVIMVYHYYETTGSYVSSAFKHVDGKLTRIISSGSTGLTFRLAGRLSSERGAARPHFFVFRRIISYM
jgi:hypothetical protein